MTSCRFLVLGPFEKDVLDLLDKSNEVKRVNKIEEADNTISHPSVI